MTIEKLDASTPDLTQQNVERLLELFPECRTEGSREDAPMVDLDLLRQALSGHLVEGPAERYRLDWPGKRQALLTTHTPIDKTLRPMVDDSVNFETTRNLFIEGDNLDALKLLQETYLGKIKMIYIDPPYNTGKDFIYRDNFSQSRSEYEEKSSQRDESGGKLVANLESNGRFHSNWISMIYPRLKLIKNILSDDGCCVISINEKEKYNLRLVLVEIFGEENIVADITIVTGANQAGDGILVQKNYESVYVVAKDECQLFVNRIDEVKGSFRNLNDAPTPFSTRPDMGYTVYYNPETKDIRPEFDYDKSKIASNDPEQVYTDMGDLIDAGYLPIRPGFRSNRLHRWRWGKETFEERRDDIVVRRVEGEYQVGFIQSGLNPPKNVWNFGGGAGDLSRLFDGNKVFDYPKGVDLMREIILLFGIKPSGPSRILDLFAGTGSLGEAHQSVLAKGHQVHLVSVQIGEVIEDQDVRKVTGVQDLAQLARERIRRAGNIVANGNSELKGKIDTGFRAFRVDSGNFANTTVTPKEATQEALAGMVSHIKDDRSEEDLLFGALLRWGVDITLPIEQRELAGRAVWLVDAPGDGSGTSAALIACFAKPNSSGTGGIDTKLADAMADLTPLRVLFRDDGFANDATKENVHSRFQQRAPDTQVRVL